MHLTDEERKLTKTALICESILGVFLNRTNLIRHLLLKVKLIANPVNDIPPPVKFREGFRTWNVGLHVYFEDVYETIKRKFKEGLENLRSYRITDGKAWHEGKRKLDITGHRETVFRVIKKGIAWWSARCR